MSPLQVAVIIMVLQGGNTSFTCNLQPVEGVTCSNGLSAMPLDADTFVLSNGIKVAPGPKGTLVLSNGITAARGSAGWIRFSSGLDARREGRHVKFSNGAFCDQPADAQAICKGAQ
jgi:hypothetical protein